MRHRLLLAAALLLLTFVTALAETVEPVPGLTMSNLIKSNPGKASDSELKLAREELAECVAIAQKDIFPRLRSADQLVFYSLSPGKASWDKDVTNDKLFHSYPILGAFTVDQPADIARWRKLLIEGFAPGSGLFCFSPRHGIRIRSKRKSLDLLTCKECDHTYVFGGVKSRTRDNSFMPEVFDEVNKLLDAAKIPRDLPKK